MIGKQGHSVLVTLVERKTRLSVAIKAANKTAQAVTDATCDNLKLYQDRVFTLAYDNVLCAEYLPGMAIKTSCRALAISMAIKTVASCAITILVIVGLLCSVVCAQPL